MATVYLGHDSVLDVFRAVKVLSARLSTTRRVRERFVNEARTMARLQHRNIVSVVDVGVDGERVYMVMELLRGGSLADRIIDHGALPPRMACDVVRALLEALAVAHESGVVHRDIKPHNVLLSSDGTPRVADFGIAQVQSSTSDMTKTGSVMGTWAYMAPEQRTDAKSVDGRSDLYAAGATLYALVTQREPFDLHSTEGHDKLFVGVIEPIAELIKGATRYRQEDRYADAHTMIAAIDAVYETLPETPEWSPPLVGTSEQPMLARSADSDTSFERLVSNTGSGAGVSPGLTGHLTPATADSEAEGTLAGFVDGSPLTVDFDGNSSGSTEIEAPAGAAPSSFNLRSAVGLGVALVIALLILLVAMFGAGGLGFALGTGESSGDDSTSTVTIGVGVESDESAPSEAPPELTGIDWAPPAAGSAEPPVEPAGVSAPVSPPPLPPVTKGPLVPAQVAVQPAQQPPVVPVAVEPSEEPAATVGVGGVFINSLPFSEVRFDGVSKGNTRWKAEGVAAGQHTVVLTTADGRSVELPVAVEVSEVTKLCWDFDLGATCAR